MHDLKGTIVREPRPPFTFDYDIETAPGNYHTLKGKELTRVTRIDELLYF